MSEFTQEQETVYASSFKDALLGSEDPINGPNRELGENGEVQFTDFGVGSSLLAYFNMLIRGLEKDRHLEYFHQCLEGDDVAVIVGTFLLAFQTRDCRGGKGEKDAFYRMFQMLYGKFPDTTLDLVQHIPHYGYWKDLLMLVKHIKEDPMYTEREINYSPLITKIYDVFATQLKEDNEKFTAGDKNLSYAAKYAPSEGHEFAVKYNSHCEIAKRIFTEDFVGITKDKAKSTWDRVLKKYRKMLSPLRATLDVTEQKMCSDRWAEIDFARVTSVLMNRCTNAFANLKKDGSVRYPDSEDRNACAANLLDQLSEINGKQVEPHVLVQQILANGRLTSIVEQVKDRQWIQARESVVEMSKEMSEIGKMILSKLFPISDVSGSMSGTPLLVSIALSVMVSELSSEAFKDLVMTFHEKPSIHSLADCTNIVQKVRSLSRADWGGSTNFLSAMTLIADIVERNKISVEDTPDLVVFSDMQFDAASGAYSYSYQRNPNWSTQYEKIIELWCNVGLRMDGSPRPVPRIIFWNLRSDTTGHVASADQEGVIMLSGYNPSLLKHFLSGNFEDQVVETVDEETGEIALEKERITPEEALRKVLADTRYDMIRSTLVLSNEGILANFGPSDPNQASLFE